MSEHYLATPRFDGDQAELRYIRDQAEFYNKARQAGIIDMALMLVPACIKCGWDKLYDDRVNLALVCERCGARNAADTIRAGRLAKR